MGTLDGSSIFYNVFVMYAYKNYSSSIGKSIALLCFMFLCVKRKEIATVNM